MEVEAFEVRVARADGPHPRGIRVAADPQHRCAGPVPERRPTANGGGAELREDGGIYGERIGLEIARIFRGEHATSSQETQNTRVDRRKQARHVAIRRRSTSAPVLLRGSLRVDEFVNADTIARGLSAFAPRVTAWIEICVPSLLL
jgi:hypothetical protein